MKRQTRPFIVEIKQSRLGADKPAAKPLWSGRDLHLLKEARQERLDESVAAPASEQELVKVAPPARVLVAATAVPPVDEPVAAATRVAPRRKRVPSIPLVAQEPVQVAAATPRPAMNPPVRLRDRAEESLPRGQRWKRRLPKVIW